MKKIITAFLCALLLSALPVLAAQPETPTAHALQATADVSTDLKFQQQKFGFFEERLEERLQMQDKRIGDLGLMIGFFGAMIGVLGALITAIVVFFSIRSKSEAVGAARDEAEEEIKKRAKEYIEKSLQPEVEKALKDIQEAARKTLDGLRKEQEVAQELNAQNRALVDKLASTPLDKDKPLTPEQKQELQKAVSNIESVPPKEYRSSDWFLLGMQAVEQGKYDIAIGHFSKAADIAESPADQAKALVSKGFTLNRQMQGRKEAIAVYDEVVKRYGNAPEAALRGHVAMALLGKITALDQLQRSEEAIAVCDEVMKRYGNAPEAALRELAAKALTLKNHIQSDKPD